MDNDTELETAIAQEVIALNLVLPARPPEGVYLTKYEATKIVEDTLLISKNRRIL